MNFRDIAKDYYDAFGFNLIPLFNKAPKGDWQQFHSQEMKINDIDECDWNSYTNGLGAISGINKLRCLDFDKVINDEIVKSFVRKLGLPSSYEWLVKSGSGKGYHIWFCCDDDSYLNTVLGTNNAYYKLHLKEKNVCDHIELRWNKCYTVLPNSFHPSGNKYEFVHIREGLPSTGPTNVGVGRLIDTLREFCVLNEKLEDRSEKIAVKEQQSAYKKADKRLLAEASEFLKGKIDNYDDFMRIGFALASLGEEGREYFLLICENNPKYPKDIEASLNKKFDGLLKDYRGDITVGTLFHIAIKNGWNISKELKKELKDCYKAAKEYLTYYYDFQFNELTQKLMWKKKTEKSFEEVIDTDISTMYITLRSDEKIFIGFEDLRRILESNFVNRIHPLKKYFENMPVWDGYDYIKDLANTISVEDNEKESWQKCFRKWMIAVVACVLSEKEVNHTAIIFQGEQGIGKTRWIQKFMPGDLEDYLFIGNIIPSDKDSKLAVVKNFIICLDELETLNRDEIGFLKSLMTQKEIQIRKPYGHYEEKFIRRSSFIGSVNKKEFLNDMTGTRRFLCFEVNSINADHGINIDKVFAQALQLYKDGERYWFDKNEADEITKQNDKFTFRSIEEEKLLEKYAPIKSNDPDAKYLTTTEIAERLFDEKVITNQIIRQLGMVMNKYHFEKISKCCDGKSLKRWAIKEITKFDQMSRNDGF